MSYIMTNGGNLLDPYSTNPSPPLVMDSWRHRFVGASSVVEDNSPPISSRTVTNTFSYNSPAAQSVPTANKQNGNSPTGTWEIDERRLAAIKNVWRRLDPYRQGWVSVDDMAKELQRASDLSASDQRRLIQTFAGEGSVKRVHYTAFIDHYLTIHSFLLKHGGGVDELLRSHWGFSEVSEILEDMKNKLVAVGIATAFKSKTALNGNVSSAFVLPVEFEQGLNAVNIHYRPQDFKRVFDAFQQSGDATGDGLRLGSFVEQLIENPRPRTPLRRPQSHVAKPNTSPLNSTSNTQHSMMVSTQNALASSAYSGIQSTPAVHASSLPPSPTMPAPVAPSANLASASANISSAPTVLVAAPSGRKRALTIGINYIGHKRGTLSGCINDSDTFINILTATLGFQRSDIRQLRDDHHTFMPTKTNIVESLRWLIEGAKDGDHLFLHYSGHGSQQTDRDGDELDGRDETLVPCDYLHAGMLSDDELRSVLVLPLSQGVRLTAILDCCHSGTVLDLPFKIILDSDGSAEVKRKKSSCIKGSSRADIVMISGCMDNQTSADIGAGAAGNTQSAGAMTTSFKVALEKNSASSYHHIIREMRRFLKQHNFKQVPQLMSEQFLNLTDCFLPEAEKPEEDPPPALRPPCRRAVTIGINYYCLPHGRGRLAGCINDSDTIVGLLQDTFGYNDSQIHRLRDDQQDKLPTRNNMLAAFTWLTGGAQAGDELFLHYSGHGGQTEDLRGDERDGKDETLLPCDFQRAGQITDDELFAILVENLPKGCKLLVVLDCCHSGTALDLRYKVSISPDGRSAKLKKRPDRTVCAGHAVAKATKADVIMLSGCKDSQTSADVQAGSMGAESAAGAMTTALRHELTTSINCHKLLKGMRRFLKRNRYTQVPQMSSEQFVQLNSSFVNYRAKRKAQRQLDPAPGIGPPSRQSLAVAGVQ